MDGYYNSPEKKLCLPKDQIQLMAIVQDLMQNVHHDGF